MCRWLVRNSSRWVHGLVWKGGWGDYCGVPETTHLSPLLQVLIGDEPEHGMENLLEVQVPEDVEQQLQQLDHQEQEQYQREQQEWELSPESQAEGAAPT